jgi:hypothetical protein
LEFSLKVLCATVLDTEERALSSAGLLEDGHADAELRVGERKGLGELGPMVLQMDGSYKRVANFAQMTAEEKERTLRVVAKRNAKRAQKLLRQQAAVEGGSS